MQQKDLQRKERTFSYQLRQRMASLEKRDWELWVLALSILAILAGGFFFVLGPAVFLGQQTLYIRASISPPVMFGFLVLVVALITYLVQKHLQIRALRYRSFVEAWNFEVSHVQMLIDPLTQAYTRSALEELLSKEIKRVQRQQASMVFLYVDVNDFKQVNTRHGHLSGDLVLAEVGGILKHCVRGSDYVIRMGGDEFLAALLDTNLAGAEAVKERINQRIREWNQESSLKGFTLSLSIGIQEFDPRLSLDEVLTSADSRMYEEKKTLS